MTGLTMGCYYPIDAYRSDRLNENGKRPITFSRSNAMDALQIPCGKCIGCRADQSMMWAIRIYHEASCHETNSFVTLTYADPPPEQISKKHLQDFFKRLRHRFDFRYFACGEYGEQTRRPHYHACFFGEDFRQHSYRISESLYGNDILAETWGHGMVSIGSLEMSSACYVAGYVNKKIGDEETFSLMSRKPPIGKEWLCKYKDDLLRTGTVSIEGRELPIPHAYMRWFEEEFSSIKLDRRLRFSNMTIAEKIHRRASLRSREINRRGSISQRSEKI